MKKIPREVHVLDDHRHEWERPKDATPHALYTCSVCGAKSRSGTYQGLSHRGDLSQAVQVLEQWNLRG